MNIRYVVSSMVFWRRENNLSLEQECQFLKSLGFGIEFSPHIKGQYECRYVQRNWHRLAAAAEGMLVSMRSREDNPSPELWNEQIDCAKLLSANIVASPKSLRISDSQKKTDWDFAKEIVKMAELNEVKLCVETASISILKELGEKFNSVGYCFNTSFANSDSVFSFKQYVDELAEKVVHIHLGDNYGRLNDHVMPGLRNGISSEDWQYLLNALSKYDNDVVGSFEMAPCPPVVMIEQASAFLFGEMKWPNQPQKHSDYANVVYDPS